MLRAPRLPLLSPLASPGRRARLVRAALGAMFVVGGASCGGSSSETPPPLEPLPANIHYNRSATTLPGELAAKPAPETAVEEAPSAAPAPPPAPH